MTELVYEWICNPGREVVMTVWIISAVGMALLSKLKSGSEK